MTGFDASTSTTSSTTVTSTSTTTSTTTGTTDGTSTTDATGSTTAVGTSGDSDTEGGSTGGDPPATCEGQEQGYIICQGDLARTCDGNGGYESSTNCSPQSCTENFGCGCIFEDTRCAGQTVQQCSEDGVWVPMHTCDPVQGSACDADMGACTGGCAPELVGKSYVGCDYYATVLAAYWADDPWPYTFGVIVANASNAVSTITVTQGPATLLTFALGPSTAEVLTLPWNEDLANPEPFSNEPSLVSVEGAYRIRSTEPMSVYQYNPIEYTVPGVCYDSGLNPVQCFSATNDASILLPTNTWDTDYMVVSHNHWVTPSDDDLPGFYAVVAQADDTTVTLSPSATGGIVDAGGGVAADGTGTITLDAGDVLEVFTDRGTGEPNSSDLTGTVVSADKPISVFGGHKCTNVPYDVPACDRLEESIPPLSTLGKDHFVVSPRRTNSPTSINPNYVRITATAADTTITYDPPQAGAPTTIANAGEYVVIPENTESFRIETNESVIVSQYMRGQGAPFDPPGDPSMTVAVPVAQYRDNYFIHAPTNYDANFVNINAPADAVITVDGDAVTLAPLGSTGWGVARVQLSNVGGGNHRIVGDQTFGVTVYGYGQYTSFWYPGGLDLEPIPQ